ncbi:MAG: hypothetical protein RL139_170 [Gemmatimonadota bacterium]|jgi:Caspase domain
MATALLAIARRSRRAASLALLTGLTLLAAAPAGAQWTSDPSDILAVTGVRVLNGAGGATIPPGETVELRIQVRNVAGYPLSAVRADIRTGDAVRVRYVSALGTTFERHRRVNMGIMNTAATATVTVRIVALERGLAVDGSIPVTVTFSARRQRPTTPIDLGLTVAGAPAPLVAAAPPSIVSPPPVTPSAPFISALMQGVPRATRPRPDAIAVIIGNRTYRRAPSVAYAANDAAAMRLYAERALGILPGNVLYVEDATLSDLKVLFGDQGVPSGRLHDLVKPGLTEVFVFYSGHGAPDPVANRAYLMPSDGDANRLALTGLPVDILYENLAALGAAHVTVVLDACFSGGTGSGEMLITQASPIGIRVTDPSQRFAASGGATIIAAAEGQQLANWYPEQQHGLLTYFFLRGLQGAADRDRDGSVTAGEMRDWLRDPANGLPYEARRLHGRDQTPQVWGDPTYRIR